MELTYQDLTEEIKESLLDTFGTKLDLDLIKKVIYFDGWSDWEEAGGYFIFLAIDDTIQFTEYFNGVFGNESENNYIHFEEITESMAIDRITAMENCKYNVNDSL